MKQRKVVISEGARSDLIALHDWIANAASPSIALSHVERLEA